MSNARPGLSLPAARLELLLQASELLGQSLDFAATLANLATLLVPSLADGYVVDLVGEHGEIQRIAAVDGDPAKAETVERLRHLRPPNPDSPQGIQRLLDAARPMLTERVTEAGLRAGARDEEHFQIMRSLEPCSMIAVPLKARGRAIGLLWLYYSRSKRTFRPADVALVEEIAARAALAMENARLWRESQQAIEARDEFLSLASHELRTPLTSLILRVQGELRRLRKDPAYAPSHADAAALLGAVDHQATRLARLIDAMLDVSGLTSGTTQLIPEEIDLGQVVGEAVRALEEEARRKGSALEVVAPAGIVGWLDPSRVGQVVMALVSNAIKYGDGKPISVVVSGDGDRGRFVVRDRGIGIERGSMSRIFERFERQVSTRNYGGFGLGLWMAHKLVDASGGTIAVESELGEGATFRVDLPSPSRDSALDHRDELRRLPTRRLAAR